MINTVVRFLKMPLVCNNTVVVKGEVVVRKTVGITGKFLDELGATPTFFF